MLGARCSGTCGWNSWRIARLNILIFGSSGQLGTHLQYALREFVQLSALGREQVDLRDPAAVADAIATARPDVVINAAAYTAVDRAESDAETARAVNADAPGQMARSAHSVGALLIHYSTDYVFAGDARTPYTEGSAVRPINVYGETKLAGERAVADNTDRYLVLRTSWVYSAYGRNFYNTMLRLAGERDELRVVDDQIGSPTYAGALADAAARLIRRYQADMPGPEWSGVYHMSCGGQTSWYGFACAIMDVAGLGDTRIVPIATSEFPTPARRPAYSVLDNGKLERTFGFRLPPWRDALRHCFEHAAGVQQR